MEYRQLSACNKRFKYLMMPDTIEQLGRDVGLCQRRRKVTPCRLALSLLYGFTKQTLDSLANLQRDHNILFGTAPAYKPFHKQLAKSAFAVFMRALADQLLEQWRPQTLRAEPGDVLAEFDRVIIQDGSSFALCDGLVKVFPERFNQYKPAVVALQTTLALFEGMPCRVHLTPDTVPERADSPSLKVLAGSLLLADRGYFRWETLQQYHYHESTSSSGLQRQRQTPALARRTGLQSGANPICANLTRI